VFVIKKDSGASDRTNTKQNCAQLLGVTVTADLERAELSVSKRNPVLCP